jgi:hypothetical protein
MKNIYFWEDWIPRIFVITAVIFLGCFLIWVISTNQNIDNSCSKFCGDFVVGQCSDTLIFCVNGKAKYKGKEYVLQAEK